VLARHAPERDHPGVDVRQIRPAGGSPAQILAYMVLDGFVRALDGFEAVLRGS